MYHGDEVFEYVMGSDIICTVVEKNVGGDFSLVIIPLEDLLDTVNERSFQ